MKRKISKLLATAALVLLTLTACGDNNESSTASGNGGDPIKIGLTTVLTGDRSLEGEYASNAAKLVQAEINEAGGVLGRDIEIVIEDALGTDIGAVNAFNKLAADDDIVAIIGTDSSNDNIAISDPALQTEILTTAQGSSPTLTDIANNENPWIFQLRASDRTLGAALMKYAVEVLGIESFSVIHDTETASADQAGLFIEALKEYGIEPNIVVPFTSGTKDFSSHLAQIESAGAEALIAANIHTEGAILLKQMESLGMDMPIFGSNSYGDPNTIALAGSAINDVYSVTAWVPNTTTEKGSAFSKKYTEMYGDEAAKAAAQIYDHVYMITEAIKRAESTDRAEVRDAMQTIDNYVGAITSYDTTTNGDAGLGGLIVQVQDEVPVIIEELSTSKQ